MKHFKDKDGNIYGLEPDGSQDHLIGQEWEPVEKPEKAPVVLTVKDFSAMAQHVLDTQARVMGYDSIFTAVSYENDPYPQFHDDAIVLKEWRSSVWVTAYSILAQVEGGAIAQPSLEEFKAMLPEFEG